MYNIERGEEGRSGGGRSRAVPVPGPRWPWRIRGYISNNIRLILDLIDYKEFITDNSFRK